MKTGLEATRLGIVAYIVPFLFVFSPALLLKGSLVDVSLAAVTAVVGAVLLGMALTGYFVREIGWFKRVFLGVAALGLLFPHVGPGILFSWVTNAAGIVLAVAILGFEVWGGFRFSHGVGVTLAEPGPALDNKPPKGKTPQR